MKRKKLYFESLKWISREIKRQNSDIPFGIWTEKLLNWALNNDQNVRLMKIQKCSTSSISTKKILFNLFPLTEKRPNKESVFFQWKIKWTKKFESNKLKPSTLPY